MKIGNNPEKVGPISAERVASTKSNGDVTGGKTQAAQPSTQVDLSTSAAGDGDFDAQKVERISQAIAKGQFTVNAEAIADKLISNAKDVLGKASR